MEKKKNVIPLYFAHCSFSLKKKNQKKNHCLKKEIKLEQVVQKKKVKLVFGKKKNEFILRLNNF